MQGRKTEREIQHEAISHAMRNSKGEQLKEKFRALSRVHCIHTIYHFEAREVKSPTLQMVCKSELKWRSYDHLKITAPSWRVISHPVWNFASLAKPNAEEPSQKWILHTMQNLAWPAKFACVISRYLPTDSARFLSQDILCNSLFSPCNQPMIGFLG